MLCFTRVFKKMYILVKTIYTISVWPLRNRLTGHFNDRAAAVLHSRVHRGVIPLLVNRVVKTQPSRIVSPGIFSWDSTMAFRWPFSEWKLSGPHLYPFRPRWFQFQIASTRCSELDLRSRGSQKHHIRKCAMYYKDQ